MNAFIKLYLFIVFLKKYLNEYDITEYEKEKLIQKYLEPTVPMNALMFRIKAAKQLTGSSIGVQSIRKELNEIYENILSKIQNSDKEEGRDTFVVQNDSFKSRKSFYAYAEFSSSVYIARTQDRKVTLTLVRKHNLAESLSVK